MRKPPYLIGMTIALVLILFGILGLFLPILQGVLLLMLGSLLILEYHDIAWLRRLRDNIKERVGRLRKK